MKIGFSSLVCPGWGLDTIVTQAAELGFQGIELRGLRGELNLPLAPELSARPDRVRERFAEHKIELVCLGSSVTLTARRPKVLAEQKKTLLEYVELAGRLGCPNVRLFIGEADRGDTRERSLARIVEALVTLVPAAARHEVTMLIENGGDFPSSNDLWFLVDAVSHPCVKACWNPVNGRFIGERPTISIPRLGIRMGLYHLCDARFDETGTLMEYQPLGEGNGEVARQIELLKGIAYRQYVIFEWPKLWVDALPEPEDALPAAAKYLKDRLEEKQAVLTAYKGDKNAPRMPSLKSA